MMKNDVINVLSLFDGMSCGQIALNKLRIKYNYYASEIDKNAIKVTLHNYPKTIQLGDITKIDITQLPKIDLLLGGSPCQGFSFAGKQLNFSDPRSKLFFNYVTILKKLKKLNPNIKFLLENVKMKKEYEAVITKYLKVNPIEINSSLVSAQNRKRLYWTNIKNVTIPDDKNILLKDILEGGVVNKDKSYCLDANYWKGGNINQYFNKSRRHLVFKDEEAVKIAFGAAQRGRNIVNNKRKDFLGAPTIQRIEVNNKEKSNCLTTVSKDSMVLVIPEATKKGFIEVNDGECFDNTFPTSKTRRGRKMDKKSNCLTASPFEFLQYKDGLIRKFTPIECERLQTVPSNKISCIFVLCKESAKNYVSVVNKNPKLLKLVLIAEKTELNEIVKSVIQNMNVKFQLTKNIVPQNVDIEIVKQTEKCTNHNQQEQNIIANNVIKNVMYNFQNQEEVSVDLNVFINIIEDKIILIGEEELVQKDSNFMQQKNGNNVLNLSGKEIMGIVEDVEKNINTKENNFISIISSLFSIKTIEQMLIIYYLFAKHVITGFIPIKTKTKNLSLIFNLEEGYTSCVPNTHRYKMLGNGWTVDVICEILKNIK